MLKAIIIGILTLAIAINSYAQDGDRIGKLEKEIQELKLRLSKIESLLSNPSKTQNLGTSGEGWKSVASWRKLSTDMDADDVRAVLGDPHRVDGGDIAHWYYQNGGKIIFMEGRIYRWEEPRK
jgi:hypothetical protein